MQRRSELLKPDGHVAQIARRECFISEKDVTRVTNLIDRNEYKRRQSPVGVRITERGFGKDRRYPITAKFNFNKSKI